MRTVHFLKYSVSSIMLVAATGIACGGEPEPEPAVSALVENRTIDVEFRTANGVFATRTLPVAAAQTNGTDAKAFFDAVFGLCRRAVNTRFAGIAPSNPSPVCGHDFAREQQVVLCVANQFLGFAQAVAPTDIFTRTQGNQIVYTFRVRRPGDAVGDDPGGAGTHAMTVPVLTSSDGATAALAAAAYSQGALLWGSAALEPATCASGALLPTIPSLNPSGRVPLSEVVASAMNEAAQLAIEASERAERSSIAAATARLSADSDVRRARVLSWRGTNDSRLEAVDLWLGVPTVLFEPTDAEPGALLTAGTRYPVVERSNNTASLVRAEELLRLTQVDPRIDPTTESVIETRVRAALVADSPSIFGEPEDLALSNEGVWFSS